MSTDIVCCVYIPLSSTFALSEPITEIPYIEYDYMHNVKIATSLRLFFEISEDHPDIEKARELWNCDEITSFFRQSPESMKEYYSQ